MRNDRLPLYRKRALSRHNRCLVEPLRMICRSISSALACSLRHDLMRRCSFCSSLSGQSDDVYVGIGHALEHASDVFLIT